MNGLLLLAIAAALLLTAYLVYGRYLVKTWGIDPKAKTPAYEKEEGVDYVPSNKWEVFGHQFSSIAGAGPVTGPVLAMVFGWLPAFLWVMVGGIFFGAVQDFGALYASVKSHGKSMGQIIETYIGKTGRKLFFLFCWLFTLLVIAAFADMVAGSLNGYNATGAQSLPSGAASQAAQVCSDQDIHVLPSKTIPQGLSACVMFNPDVELEDNLAEMNEAIENVKSGEVTYAIKDTTYDGLEIKKDEYMGIFGKDICVSCPDCMEATKKLLDKMLDDDSELVTLIYGDTATEEQAEEIAAYIEDNSDAEVEIHEGNQPVYSFIIGVE